MYPTSAFNQAPLGYPYPSQQPPGSLYQSQYGGVAGFNHQVPPSYQQGSQSRGQSLPAPGRQYPPASSYAPPPPSSSRRHQHGQYPPPAPSQHYEYRSTHGSKSKKHHKRRSVSPSAGEQGLYSDQEQQRKERPVQSEGQPNRSRSASPALASRSKQEGAPDTGPQQQPPPPPPPSSSQLQSQTVEAAASEATQGGVARSEEEQAVGDPEKRRSSSKKKRHHRRDRYDNYSIPPPPQDIPHDHSPSNPFHPPPQSTYFGEFQNELPPQLKVHRQPLYNGYNQAYEDSIRRGDVYRKQAKRSTRLPPEVKQQLLPHEDDQQNHPPSVPPPPPPSQQQYPYGPTPGYPQPPPPPSTSGPQSLQPFGSIRPSYNPYQPYGPPPAQTTYYSTMPASMPYNTLSPWSNMGPVNGPAEQEIQRLRSHIHTLEGELHKLQRKLNKATLNNNEPTGGQGDRSQDEGTRSHRRSKRDGIGSPRQTPVIVELNNTTGEAIRESSSKKHRHRTTSSTSAPQGQLAPPQDAPSTQRSADHTAGQETISTTGAISDQNPNQPTADARDRSRSGGNQIPETENKSSTSKHPREETAAQLAHAAAAHVNNRPGVAPGPPSQQQGPAPPPPPVPQNGRPQLPNQQQQFLFQQGVLQGPGQQIRGPPPRLPGPGNTRFPNDPYQQQQQQQQQQQHQLHQQQQQQQRNIPNPNYNQSNNNELLDGGDDDEDRRKQDEQSRSAEKILDAFERFYVNRGKPTTVPMKVKYIPEDDNSNSNTNTKRSNNNYQQRNTNNNNRYRSTSRQTRSNSSCESESDSESIYSHSPLSSRRSLYENQHRKTTIGPFI